MYKQIIIARKDLNMSYGKLAAQVAHASMAFLTNMIKDEAYMNKSYPYSYSALITVDNGVFEQWIANSFTKCVLEAKNKSKLLKAKTMAEEMGFKENKHFFLIRDNCNTELQPEDEDGRTLTCIGFIPMDSEIIDKIGKKYQLYK